MWEHTALVPVTVQAGFITLNMNLTSSPVPPPPTTQLAHTLPPPPEEGCLAVEAEVTRQDTGNDVASHAQTFQLSVLLPLAVIGCPFNVINMAVFAKQGLRDRVNVCLLALSLTDLLYLVFSFSLNSENVLLLLTTGRPKSHWNRFLVNHNLICFLGTGFISLTLSAIIACERCFCVLSPLKYQGMMRARTMTVIVVTDYVLLFSLHFLVAYKYRVGCVYSVLTGRSTTALVEGDFYRAHRELIDGLEGIFFGAVISGGVMIVVAVTTAVTTVKLRQMTTWRSETASSSSSSSSSSTSKLSSRDVALTKMLIANSVFFLICASPSCLFRLAWLVVPGLGAGGQHHDIFLSALWILEGFCYINYTFNFLVYFVMGSRYRQTFWSLMGKGGGGGGGGVKEKERGVVVVVGKG